MKFTGEFFIPPDSNENAGNHELEVEHKLRYLSVARLCKDKVVLDIASGEGYGSHILAGRAARVFGVDINPELTAHAAQKYPDSNLTFQTGSVENIPLPDHSVDIVVSFETIEHIDGNMQRKFLSEAKRVLREGGMLVMSTPDRKNYSDRYNYHNEFHIRELDKEEFSTLLKEQFAYVNLFDQGFEVTNLILNENSYRSGDVLPVFRTDERSYLFEGKYFIALCSDSRETAMQPLAAILPESPRSFLSLTDTIIRLQNEVEELGAWGRRSNAELDEARKRIIELQEQHEQLSASNRQSLVDQLIQERDSLLTEKEASRAEKESLQAGWTALQTEKENVQAEISALRSEKERLEQDLHQQYKASYELKRQLKNKENELTTMSAEKREIESHKLYKLQAEKKELESRLQEIYSSDGYRLLSIYYRTKDKLIPENSGRHKKLKKFKQFLKSNPLIPKLRGKTPPPAGNPADQSQPPIPDVPAGVTFPVVFPVEEAPVVSIVIPAYNNWAFTRNCLISIYHHTNDVPYEVIIGDNVSTDETVNLQKYFSNVNYLRNKENLGYILNVNNAAAHARGQYILTLNNDTTVTPGWLSHLVNVMEQDPKVGLVGSKLVYPNGSLQEAGGIIWKDASGWNYGREGNPDAPEYNYLKEVDYVSGASNLIRKEIWDRLKGLDERYIPAYFDDSDLAFGIRRLGYKTVYQPLSVVIHYEGMAHGTDTSSGTKRYQVVNREKFVEKWLAVLASENFPNGQDVFYARDKSKGKKTIVVIDHYVPHFDKDAGSRNTFQLLKLFVKLGYNVKFIGDNFYKHEPYTTVLQQMGIEVLYGEYYRDSWADWIMQNSRYIDFFYINRPHISTKYIDLIREKTNGKVIYFGHDLHFIRERHQYEIEKDPLLLVSAEEWKKTESDLIRKSNTVLTLSCDEKEIMEKEIGHSDIQVMPIYFYTAFNEPVTNFDERHDLLFVGGFNHKPNIDAVLWFAKEVFPVIQRQLKQVRFIIVGSNAPKEITQLASDSILVKGYVSDNELEQLYRTAKMVVIPLRYGAGVKGKTVEAIYHGIPFVSTRFGIEGLSKREDLGNAEDTAAGFARKVIDLYSDRAALEEFSRKEIAYAKTHFSEEHITNLILNIFKT